MPIYQVLPDRHGIAATREAVFDEFAVGFAGAGDDAEVGGHLVAGFAAVRQARSRWSPHWPVLPVFALPHAPGGRTAMPAAFR